MISINIGKCKIKINFYFFAVITIIVVLDKSGFSWHGILAAILHEFGHIFAMMIKGNLPKEIKFDIFNIDIIDNFRQKRNYKDDIFILIFGAFTNFIIAIFSFIIYYYTKNISFLMFFWTNLFVGVFNILPISTLDGGQILYLFLEGKFGIHKSFKIVEILSLLALIPLLLIGFLILLKSKYNFSLLFISCYLIIMAIFKNL